MRIALALAAFLAFVPNANAAPSGEKQFTPNMEFRIRPIFEDNQSGTTMNAPNNGNVVEQRIKLGGQYKFSEKFSATATLVHAANWGSQDLYVYNTNGTPGAWSSGDGAGVHSGIHGNNLLLVNEAYGSWLVSEDFILRFGRGGLTMADGSVISTNDWQQNPTSFDGVLGVYEFDMFRLSAWVIKFAQYADSLNALAFPGSTTSKNFESDPEANAYGLAVDFKRMPEFLKMVNIHVIQNTKATTPGAFYNPGLAANPLSRMGQNVLRYGLTVGGGAGMVDFKVTGAGMTGKYHCMGNYMNAIDLPDCGSTDVAGNFVAQQVNSMNVNAYMAQGEVGFNFPEFMKARVFGKVHYDTGDKDRGSAQTDVKTYDGYFYDRHAGSGHMEVVNFGNLTFYNAGLQVSPTDQTNVTLQYFYFLKTSAEGRMNPGRFGEMTAMTSPNSDKLGQEIDLIAEHKYDGGFTILTSVGLFIPGSAIKDGIADDPLGKYLTGRTIAGGRKIEDATRDAMFTQFMVQGKIGF